LACGYQIGIIGATRWSCGQNSSRERNSQRQFNPVPAPTRQFEPPRRLAADAVRIRGPRAPPPGPPRWERRNCHGPELRDRRDRWSSGGTGTKNHCVPLRKRNGWKVARYSSIQYKQSRWLWNSVSFRSAGHCFARGAPNTIRAKSACSKERHNVAFEVISGHEQQAGVMFVSHQLLLPQVVKHVPLRTSLDASSSRSTVTFALTLLCLREAAEWISGRLPLFPPLVLQVRPIAFRKTAACRPDGPMSRFPYS
jgi:hypothetical protein